MTLRRSKTFAKDFKRLPQNIQQKAERQLRMLITDWRHPSLSAKKMKGHPDIWEARVDYHHRITFQIARDIRTLRTINDGQLHTYKVSRELNSGRNNSAALIKPI